MPSFNAEITAIEPAFYLYRSFDQRWWEPAGYVVFIGEGDDARSVLVEEQLFQERQLRVGDTLSCEASPVGDPPLRLAGYHKVSGLEVLRRETEDHTPPPWQLPSPSLQTYAKRGFRRLAKRTYDSKCRGCMWACQMPVEMTIDHWNPDRKKYRTETWCFGPLSCRLYKSGRPRKVPGRKGMVFTEEDWIDEDATSHREEGDEYEV